jgi:hypothetical protein
MTFAGGGNSSFVGLGFHRCGGRAFLKGESGRWLGTKPAAAPYSLHPVDVRAYPRCKFPRSTAAVCAI